MSKKPEQMTTAELHEAIVEHRLQAKKLLEEIRIRRQQEQGQEKNNDEVND
jgi:hypothetical protein